MAVHDFPSLCAANGLERHRHRHTFLCSARYRPPACGLHLPDICIDGRHRADSHGGKQARCTAAHKGLRYGSTAARAGPTLSVAGGLDRGGPAFARAVNLWAQASAGQARLPAFPPSLPSLPSELRRGKRSFGAMARQALESAAERVRGGAYADPSSPRRMIVTAASGSSTSMMISFWAALATG